ncbi:hypothetical protein B0H17DRAFT_1141808 [Mycena rosella]|uniref:Uncharacterized protein n=1 Tax=Mycena rosella TaxID=1033263 RepID=A0AAD7GA71_MYCRO|nr:hypothetical protein B0H17DRAFT_1141808 [Mycena rosella]
MATGLGCIQSCRAAPEFADGVDHFVASAVGLGGGASGRAKASGGDAHIHVDIHTPWRMESGGIRYTLARKRGLSAAAVVQVQKGQSQSDIQSDEATGRDVSVSAGAVNAAGVIVAKGGKAPGRKMTVADVTDGKAEAVGGCWKFWVIQRSIEL